MKDSYSEKSHNNLDVVISVIAVSAVAFLIPVVYFTVYPTTLPRSSLPTTDLAQLPSDSTILSNYIAANASIIYNNIVKPDIQNKTSINTLCYLLCKNTRFYTLYADKTSVLPGLEETYSLEANKNPVQIQKLSNILTDFYFNSSSTQSTFLNAISIAIINNSSKIASKLISEIPLNSDSGRKWTSSGNVNFSTYETMIYNIGEYDDFIYSNIINIIVNDNTTLTNILTALFTDTYEVNTKTILETLDTNILSS